MATVIVIGAGMGGLSTAMLLAHDGHDVAVLERDPEPPPTDPREAWDTWERRGVNQFRMGHVLLPRWRQVAERELPDVVAAIEAGGGLRWNALTHLPDRLTGGPRRGDHRYDLVTGSRPMVEATLARVAGSTDGVTVRRGVAVTGLLTGEPTTPDVPHVVGVRTESGEDLRADLVVDTGGRRSPLPRWLTAIGARPPIEEAEDCGFVYYGQSFRSPTGEVPSMQAMALQPYTSLSVLTLPADNGHWAVAFVTSARDRELRALRDPERWHAALALYSLANHWAEGEPTTEVEALAKIEDRYRRLVVDGTPVATGVVAVGDAWACTNPSLGRGITMGLLHACELRDLLRDVAPSEPHKLAMRWDEVTRTALEPIYRATLAFDRHRLAEIDAQIEGKPYETDDPTWALATAFQRAAYRDPEVFRWISLLFAMFATPDEVVSVPGRAERIAELGADDSEPILPGPDRAELLAVVSR